MESDREVRYVDEATLERAVEAAVRAAMEAFRTELARSGRPAASEPTLGRYKTGSWKRDVLEFALRLTRESGSSQFRFSDLKRFEAEIRDRHAEQQSPMAGVAVTLQALVRDGALRQVARGLYQVS